MASASPSSHVARLCIGLVCAAALTCGAFTCASALPPHAAAWAAESASEESAEAETRDYSEMSLDDLKKEVESLTASRDALDAQSKMLAANVADVSGKLAQAKALVVDKQQLAERSVRERYKVQRQYGTLFDALLDADDLQSFIAGVEYIEAASKVSVSEYSAVRASVAELEQTLDRLQMEKDAVDANLEQTSAELEAATKARDEEQRKADLVSNTELVPDGADWDAGEEAFIAEWAPRIDAYLDGSPMSGLGEAFAKAAWTRHIDPRFSPAISNVESGKGRICIRPYNAWGWGAADSDPYGLALEWRSWEEAINAHVTGLATLYGYTASPAGAKMYCPPNWQEWYAKVVTDMNHM